MGDFMTGSDAARAGKDDDVDWNTVLFFERAGSVV